MKQILLFALLVVIASCSKKRCYQCIKTTTQMDSNFYGILRRDTTQECDMTTDDKSKKESTGTYTEVGGYKSYVTKCN